MMKSPLFAAALAVAAPLAPAHAAVLAPPAQAVAEAAGGAQVHQIQDRRGSFAPRPGYYGGRPYGPRPFYGPRPYYGPGAYYGRPGVWVYRPWYRRPYYGTVVGGIVIGTVIVATAYGVAPRPPRPDLCWYWADPDRSRGYWDYCY